MKLLYTIIAKTIDGQTIQIDKVPLKKGTFISDGFEVDIKQANGYFTVKVTPPGSPLATIAHRVTIGLRNFHTVIVPDSGREYPMEMQLVSFWAKVYENTHFDVKAPIFIFTGQNQLTDFAFGIVGEDYESRFTGLEPARVRALQAHYRRLTLEIMRGTDTKPIPKEISQRNHDLSIEEGIFVRDYDTKPGKPWLATLGEFADCAKEMFKIRLPFDAEALEPLWCSWTDWNSAQMNEEIVLDNVKAGVELGIKNFIIDDGWFGPALDSEFGTKLVFGDWNADGTRFKDIRQLSRKIRQIGGRSMIWCAPHTITPSADSFRKHFSLLMKDAFGVPVITPNKLNLFCLKCKESRDAMVEICARLATEYETDGAKYDLFNIYPKVECEAIDHEHDTESNMFGLSMLMEAIWTRVREINPKYIVELKQNYGWVFLSRWGSMVRAGDTPYNPEGNYMRTAFVQAYDQCAINDYQTITGYDSVEDSAKIVIKMIAVGIPTYSMDITTLPAKHKKMLAFYNGLYMNLLQENQNPKRIPLDANMGLWLWEREKQDVFFSVNEGQNLNIKNKRDFQVINANIHNSINFIFDFDAELELTHLNCMGENVRCDTMQIVKGQHYIVSTETSGVVSVKIV